VAINISADVPIYIELDSSPQMTSLYEKITIFQYLEKIEIPRLDWNHMDINNLSGIQLVANYLQAISDGKIKQEEINEENLIEIDKLACSKLLREQFISKKDDEQISWTRLTILVKIYHYLFSGFSKCGYFVLLPDFIQNAQLRMDILQYLLKSSEQFTSFSVESVRKKQRSTSDAILQLDESIIRWDKLQPFTVIFNDSNDPLFVYKTINDVPSSLINAIIIPARKSFFGRFPFLNRQKGEERKQKEQQKLQFPDYNTLQHSDFFIKLASLTTKYFIKSVCSICYKQHEYEDETCINCGPNSRLIRPETFNESDVKSFQLNIANMLEKEYVWTADNYIKALLIYLRVQCHVPIIVMGETGNIKYSCNFLSLREKLPNFIASWQTIVFIDLP
jgi:hypothetical protein